MLRLCEYIVKVYLIWISKSQHFLPYRQNFPPFLCILVSVDTQREKERRAVPVQTPGLMSISGLIGNK